MMTEDRVLHWLTSPQKNWQHSMYKHLMALTCAGLFVASAQTAHASINAWTSHGPGGGCVAALAIDPTTPGTLYAGTDDWNVFAYCPRSATSGSGVFKSTDGGGTWSALNTLGTSSGLGVLALAIDPTAPSTLYAGTEVFGNWPRYGGLFKSTDGGGTWNAVGESCDFGGGGGIFPGFPPLAIAIDPTMPSTLYANGCKSTDGGDTWQVQASPVCRAVAIDPTMTSTLYGGCLGVSKSTDGGGTWSAVNTGLGTPLVLALALDPGAPSTLYAGTDGGVFKSTDGGDTWSAVNMGVGSPMVFVLAIDPTISSRLYAGTDSGVFKSTDGGGTWSALNTGLPANSSVTALAIDPTAPSTLYAGTDGGGVFSIEQVSTCDGDCNADGGATVDELVTLVNIALGATSVVECGSGDANGDGQIAIDEITTAVNVVLEGCRPERQLG